MPIVILAVLFVVTSRAPSEPTASTPAAPSAVLITAFEHLAPLSQGHYELWVQRPDGGEDRLAVFAVGSGGALFTLNGEPVQEFPLLELPPPRSTLVVTAESGGSSAAVRSPRVVLRGTLEATTVTFEPVLSDVSSKQVALLLAPTDKEAPDTTGIWFSGQTGAKGRPAAGLTLPPSPEGWAYGGFITTAAGTILRTGLFTDPKKPDQEALYSGKRKGLPYPGEDFVTNAPEGTAFPLNLADGRTTITVSLEPTFARGSAQPFLPLLTARIPFRQKSGEAFALEAVSRDTFPRGSGKFEQRSP